jgi:adenosylhomocysteine nucleosidase
MKGQELEVRSQESDGVLVCFAVKEEAAPFKKLLGDSSETKILITGIGEKNARRAFRDALESFTPSLVVTCGFAGALNPDLKIGDVIFLTVDPGLDEVLVKLGASPSSFLCAPRIATTAAEKEKLRRETGASAVEMESGVINEICRERGILRHATVRVISDTAHEDLPLDFNALMTADQKISLLKLTGAILKSPGKVPHLLKLQRNTKMAAERLAEVLNGLLRAFRSGSTGTVE